MAPFALELHGLKDEIFGTLYESACVRVPEDPRALVKTTCNVPFTPALTKLTKLVSEIHLVDSVAVCSMRNPPENNLSPKCVPNKVRPGADSVIWLTVLNADKDGRS